MHSIDERTNVDPCGAGGAPELERISIGAKNKCGGETRLPVVELGELSARFRCLSHS